MLMMLYPLDATRTIFDLDVDDVADSLDNCPASANTDQSDLDQDGLGDACDDDIDGDQCPNIEDAYPTDSKRCEVGVQKSDRGSQEADPMHRTSYGKQQSEWQSCQLRRLSPKGLQKNIFII